MNWRVPIVNHLTDMVGRRPSSPSASKPSSESAIVFRFDEPELSSPGFLLVMGELSTPSSTSTSTTGDPTQAAETGATTPAPQDKPYEAPGDALRRRRVREWELAASAALELDGSGRG